MARSELGELIVHFRAENADLTKKIAQLEGALTRAERTSDRSAQKVVASMGRMAAGFITVSAAVQAFTRAMADTAALDRLATATGIPIEQLSSLRTVAEQNGVTFTELQQILGQFSNRLREFVASPTSAGAQALRLLGIDARDAAGNLRTFEDMLPQLADSFARYADGANKAAISSALFGEQGGPAMVRFLNQGSTAIAAQRAELERTGQVVDKEGIEKSREYQRVMANLNTAVDSLARDFALALAPSITEAAKAINGFLTELRLGVSGGADLGDTLRKLQERQAKLKTDLADPGWWGAFARASGATEELAKVEQAIAKIQGRVEGMLRGTIVPNIDPPRELPQAPNLGAQQEAIRLINEQLQITQDRLSGLPVAYQTAFGTSAWAPAYLEAMEAIDKATAMGAITAQRAGQMKLQIQRAEQNAIMDTVSAASQAVTAVFGESKGAAIAAAIMNTGVAITRALASGPPPWNFAQAALVAAAGAAQIASIKSTNKDGGGGAAAAPSAGGGEAAAGGGGLNNTLTVQGIGPADWLRGDTVRDLLDEIAAHQRDGYHVVVAPR